MQIRTPRHLWGGRGSPSVRSCLLLLVLACVMPATLGAALLLVEAYRDGRDALTTRALATSSTVMGAIDAQISDATAALQVLATSPALEVDRLDAFQAQALRVLPYQAGNNFVLTDLTGQQRVNTMVPFGVPLPRHGSPELQRAVAAGQQPRVSDLFVGGLLRRPLVAVEVPVVVREQVRYTLAMGFVPDRFARILAQVHPEPGWVIAVFDRTGTVVARTHHADRFVGQKGAPALTAALQRSPQGVVETDTLEGVPVIAAFTRSPVTGWTVAVGVPKQVLLSRVQQGIALLTAAAVGLLVFGALIAGLVSRRIASAIDSLIAPAEALGRGEPVHAATVGLREADAVAQALQRAAALLQERTAERDMATEASVAARLQARRMEHAALHDALTQLPNRAHFEQVLAQRIDAQRSDGEPLCVFFVDLDDFKPVNDTYGHKMGDQLLRSFAGRLITGTRATDLVARLGGDEFAMLLEGVSEADAKGIASGLIQRLARPYSIDGIELHVSASIGVACWPRDGHTAEQLLQAADAAMYRAKASGKGGFAVSGFTPL